MPTPAVDRQAFLERLLSREGCPYVYGGAGAALWTPRGLIAHDFADDKGNSLLVYDCKNVILCTLYELGWFDKRPTWNAHLLATELPKVQPSEVAAGPLKRGTVACYGDEDEAGLVHISHVMVVVYHDKGAVFGASGGGRDTTSPEIARRQGAKVRFRPRLDYRRDLKWYVHLPLSD